jgi:serine/threonine-protein phosphatase 2A regulatory subunit A
MMEVAAAIDGLTANADIVSFSTRILHDSDNEVSVAALTSLLEYVDHVNLAGMTPAMLPTILEIAFESHWRIEIIIIKVILSFARSLGLGEFTKSCSRLLIFSFRKRYSMYAKQW